MQKIGFIDYYLDEWHANNYPALINEISGGDMKVEYAYAMIDSPHGGLSTDEWCEQNRIMKCGSIEELVEKSDLLVVLSPDNCEMHEELCQLPLRSGKRTFVDKTFAPDKAAAERIFAIAEEHGTPCYSTSALRFADEYRDIDTSAVTTVNSWGTGEFDNYSVHQLEPVVMLMKSSAKQVMALPGDECLTLAIEFADGRYGTITQYAAGSPFMMNICSKDENRVVNVESDFFHAFIAELVDFFRNGTEKVPHQDTISIMALRGAGLEAMKRPGVWISL